MVFTTNALSRCRLLLVLLACYGGVVHAQEQGAVFSVTDYGVVGDGVTENAEGIQQAIDAAAAAGGGVVRFPAGEYRTTTIFLKDNVAPASGKGGDDQRQPQL